MKRSCLTILTACATLLALLLCSASAQADYAFMVPKMRLQVFVQPDASVRLVYDIEFENKSASQRVDVVDVGLPHADYDLSNMKASIDDAVLTNISKSTYIDIGVEVQLGQAALGYGETGTFHFEATMPDMVYNDTTNDELASLRITPTWFDSSATIGFTDLQLAVHLPEGVDAGKVLHQGVPFYNKAMLEGHAVLAWRWERTTATSAHMVGLSFPRSSMDRVVTISRWDLLLKWWEAAVWVRGIVALVSCILFAIFFLRFTGGTGWSVLLLILGAALVLLFNNPTVHLYSLPGWFALLPLLEWGLRRKRSKHLRDYLPPIVSIEGGGIKRGLTAPEAAVLLELSLGKVLTLVLFGMLKKGLVIQLAPSPLRVGVYEPLRTTNRIARRRKAVEMKTVIHEYEHDFLDAIARAKDLDVQDIDFEKALKALIEHVADRVGGFDLDKTREYYRFQIKKAWMEAKSIRQPEPRTKAVDQNLEWLLISDDWSSTFGSWHSSGYHYQPLWLRSGSSIGSSAVDAGGLANAASGAAQAAPSFGDVSSSFAGWFENVAGGVADSLSPVGLGHADAGKGVLNLSGADKVTGDVLGALFSGSGSGGGGGGGCACAGCACACACAGGGR